MKDLTKMNNNQNRRPGQNKRPPPGRTGQTVRPVRPGQPGQINQTRRPAASAQKRRKKSGLSVYGYRIAVFLVFFAAISGISAGIFFFTLTRISPPPDIVYAVNYTSFKTGKETPEKFNISLAYETGFANRTHYFPITAVMEQLDLTLTGDKNEFSLIRLKYGEYIKFAEGGAAADINGETYRLPAPFIISGDTVYAPLDFMQAVFLNFSYAPDENIQNRINVFIADSAGPCMRVQKTAAIEAVAESPEWGTAPITLTADLSAYEQYFNPPADTRGEYIALMNHTNPLDPPDYIPPDLTDLADTRKDGRNTQQLRFYPAMALEAFLIEARANGMKEITVTSAYRSYAYQNQLFNEEAARLRPAYGDEAETIAAYSVMPPGHSEHQSGLGVDMHTISTGAAQEFGNTPEGRWLAENAHQFGFILRYPAEKTDITGVKYEPWHFRYVGRQHAVQIYERGVCLEEYLNGN